jgi:uncharacterized delta-60 repeat protein
VIIGGDFTQVGAVTRNHLARLRADGTLDSAFSSVINDSVNTIALQPDGRLVVGGDFTSVDGSLRFRLARLTSAGVLDTTLVAAIDGSVNSIVVDPDDRILAGGSFLNVNITRCPGLVRLLPTGALDTSFNTGQGPNAAVHAVAVQPVDASILIGGDFTTYDDIDRHHVARLLPDGMLDSRFDIGSGADATIRAVTLSPDNTVVIGGDFLTVNGLPRRGIARLHAEAPASLDIYRLTRIAGQWTVEFHSLPGVRYALLASTNLVNWTQVSSDIATGDICILSDPGPADLMRCFYRITQLAQ